MLPPAPEHKKSCKAFTLLQLNVKILLPSTQTLFHYMVGGKILFPANGGENSAVNSKCSLTRGCTGEPKVPLLFRIHLMYPCWGSHEQLCPSLTEILSSALCFRKSGDEGAAQGIAAKKVKFPLVSELCLYRATEHCNILSVWIHPWYLLVKLMPTHYPPSCCTDCTCAFTLFHGLASFFNTITELE